ncbi:MAG: molybdopterin-dependent oxidoreductase, partial [Acidobacteriota bacterium]
MKVVERATGALHPGQTATRKWPVVGEKAPPAEALDLRSWRLEIVGRVDHPLVLTYDEVLALPQERLVADIHCVTSWSHLGMRLDGTPLALLLERVGVKADARFVRFVAYSDRDHDTSLPLELARSDTWVIHGRDGEPLEPKHGGPLRTVTPSRYFYKSLKWLRTIELRVDDQLGYWERESAYHNNADPIPGDQRFTTGSVRPENLERFLEATDFRPYRGPRRVMIGVDLRGWTPRSREIGDLYLKACDLRDVDLSGADLRGANLSLCDLRGARLEAANLHGADLEGARFAGADLRGADLGDTALSAASFREPGYPDARVE